MVILIELDANKGAGTKLNAAWTVCKGGRYHDPIKLKGNSFHLLVNPKEEGKLPWSMVFKVEVGVFGQLYACKVFTS